jgi:hypothetical protein
VPVQPGNSTVTPLEAAGGVHACACALAGVKNPKTDKLKTTTRSINNFFSITTESPACLVLLIYA